ncbi:MAG: S8 family serine peptidase [Clostridia bacterium]|nr:S8 family serine peptidase [Clostridia bacterium]
MFKKFTKCSISIILAIILVMNLSSMTYIDMTLSSKISSVLLEKMDEDDTAEIPVSIWTTSPDISVMQQDLQMAVNVVQTNSDTSMMKSSKQASMDEIKMNYRTSVSEIYLTANNDFSADYIDEEDIIFVSRYAPMILANLTRKEILELSKLDSVEGIDYQATPRFEETDSISAELGVSYEVLSQNYISYTGSGIKIGILDMGVPYASDIPDCNVGGIWKDENNQYQTDENGHCTNVTNIIMQYAPDATYYFACGTEGDPATFFEWTEWLIDQGVTLINMSRWAWEENVADAYFNTYGNLTKWFDHIAYSHYILVVKASGHDSSNGVHSPGMSYNIITVGAMEQNNNTFTLADYSSYYTGNVYASKPDIVAEGRYNGDSGTSYATPHVTGIVACMLECNSMLEYSPELIKAILTSSVHADGPRFGPFMRSQTALSYMQVGAGFANASNALTVTSNNQSRCSSLSPTQQSYSSNLVVSSDNVGCTYRVSMAYTIPAECVGVHTEGVTATNPFPNLDLEIYAPNSTTPLIVSNTTFNNVEIVEFTPQVSGTYVIKIVQTTASTDTVYWGVAWNIYTNE